MKCDIYSLFNKIGSVVTLFQCASTFTPLFFVDKQLNSKFWIRMCLLSNLQSVFLRVGKKKKCGNDINLQKLSIAYRTYEKIQ